MERSVRETEDRWRTALQTAEEALHQAEAQDQLEKDLEAFKSQTESVQSWIRDKEQNLQSPEQPLVAQVSSNIC